MFRKLSIKDLYVQLIVVNLAIFLLANIANSLGSTFFMEWFAIQLEHPFLKIWTLITAQFLHVSFGHVFSNMIFLLLFGFYAQHFFKKQSVLSIYIIGGIAGILLSLLIGKTMGQPSGVSYGASAAVFAIMGAVAFYHPEFKVNMFLIGPVKLKWIAIVLAIFGVVIDFGGNVIGSLAHLGGGLFGMYYAYMYRRKGKNILGWLDKWFAKIGLGNETSTTKSKVTSPPMRRDPRSNSSLNLDKILDKISKSGMNSLSKEEKDFLHRS